MRIASSTKAGLVSVIFTLIGQSASASTWNVFNAAFNEDAIFFFDADSVLKHGE